MNIKLFAEHHLEFLSLKGGCTGSSESTLVKIPHCWKSHVPAQFPKIKPTHSFGTYLIWAKPSNNAHADKASRARGLNSNLYLHLHTYLVYKSSRGSGKSLSICCFTKLKVPKSHVLAQSYSKCSKISNTFLFLFSNKTLVFRAGIHNFKMLVRIANRKDPDQTAS